MILDLFAGPGGWDEGLRAIGRTDVIGIEIDESTAATAEAAGHSRITADVTTLEPQDFPGVEGLIASPPCQPFSDNGKRGKLADPRGHLTHEPMRWIRSLRPTWVAFEQVASVLPIWRECAVELRLLGYSAWPELIDAADYGVPQHRQRAILVATRSGAQAQLPPASHVGRRQVSMASALNWDNPSAWRVNTGLDWKKGQPREAAQIILGTQPATTITTRSVGQWRIYPPNGEHYRGLTESEASILQTFPADYPWHGRTQLARARQIGNAIPPRLAAAILGQLSVDRPARPGADVSVLPAPVAAARRHAAQTPRFANA